MKTVKILKIVLIILLLLVMTLSGHKIILYYKGNKENEEIKKEIIENYIEEVETTEEEVKYEVDFESLKKENPDTVGYLKVNGTNIDYVVVKGSDNSFYLKHSFNRSYNISGWIFADFHNQFNGYDKNIVIFGHNTLDGSMFGTLKNVLTKEWQENSDNHKVLFITEDGESIYEVFSVYTVLSEDYYIKTQFNDDFDKFVEIIKKRSIYDFKVDVDENDKVLTLSTCTSDRIHRVVLHAKKL